MSKITDVRSESIKELRRRLDIYMNEFHREHNLINNRMTWYVTSQSFLAIAVAGAGQANHSLVWLVSVIPIVGLAVSGFTYASILAALSVQETLRKKKDELIDSFFAQNDHTEEQKAIAIEPWGIRGGGVQKYGMYAPKFIPIVMMVFWILVLVVPRLYVCSTPLSFRQIGV